MHTTAYLGIGSNLGDRLGNIKAAINALRIHPRINLQRIAPLYETPPCGGPRNQPDYLNTAVKIKTSVLPFELLSVVKSIEHSLKRKTSVRWGARSIDLDILFYADLIFVSEQLIIPHPLLHQRNFVVQPLVDIAPAFQHPLLNLSMGRIAQRLPKKDIRLYRASSAFAPIHIGASAGCHQMSVVDSRRITPTVRRGHLQVPRTLTSGVP